MCVSLCISMTYSRVDNASIHSRQQAGLPSPPSWPWVENLRNIGNTTIQEISHCIPSYPNLGDPLALKKMAKAFQGLYPVRTYRNVLPSLKCSCNLLRTPSIQGEKKIKKIYVKALFLWPHGRCLWGVGVGVMAISHCLKGSPVCSVCWCMLHTLPCETSGRTLHPLKSSIISTKVSQLVKTASGD